MNRKERKGRKEFWQELLEDDAQMDENALSKRVIGAAIDVHRQLGPGLLESVYEECLAHEMSLRGIPFERQKPVPVVYKGVRMETGFRLDFLVGEKLIIELKAIDALAPIHDAQVITYLRLCGCKPGLLLNFNVVQMRDGIKRLVLNL